MQDAAIPVSIRIATMSMTQPATHHEISVHALNLILELWRNIVNAEDVLPCRGILSWHSLGKLEPASASDC